MRPIILLYLAIFVLSLFPDLSFSQPLKIEKIGVLRINSAITPSTYDYLRKSFSGLSKTTLVVIRINTPGGLVSTTKDIITLMGNEDRPVAVWITPEGASASSAGAIIASAAHFILMAPGTNMGAATPVGMGEDIKESDGRKKAVNDLTAMVRSLSEQRGRPAQPFEEMILNAKSYTDREALKLGIINGVASEIADVERIINGKTITLLGKSRVLQVDTGTPVNEIESSMGQKILDVIANPSTAYFLFLIGVALIYFEFQAPGGYISGSAGVCFLILAAIAFQVLPLDWGALGLLLLGMVFFIMEIFVTSYGLLSLAGLVSFVLGSLFLFKGDSGFISIEYPVMFSTLAGVFVSVGFLAWYLIRDQKNQPQARDFFLPDGATGMVMSFTGSHFMVKVRGEIWKGVSPEALSPGDQIEVTKVDQAQLLIHIKKVTV